ncbi:MAG: hypothetical protein ACPHDT_16255 [Acidimicrobiales bacterium]
MTERVMSAGGAVVVVVDVVEVVVDVVEEVDVVEVVDDDVVEVVDGGLLGSITNPRSAVARSELFATENSRAALLSCSLGAPIPGWLP